ncbi:MAG: M23 family metallopeptidase [Rhodospirillaceae bacterium]
MTTNPDRWRHARGLLGIVALVALAGCASPIEPSPFAKSQKAAAASTVTSGCTPIGSEWRAMTNVNGYNRNRPHEGIVIHAPRGTPILAAAPGTVLLVDSTGGGGRFIALHHGADGAGNHVYTTYWHLDGYDVAPGATVKRGQRIATMGATGSDAGGFDNYHLHMVPLVGPAPPPFEGGELSALQFNAYRNLIVNPRFLWHPYDPGGTPPSPGVATAFDPTKDYGDVAAF